jgi:CAP12/Pycsar effector protein, TIR domain
MAGKPSSKAKAPDKAKRTYVSQASIPRLPLSQALRVARAIADNYGKAPTKPLRVAEALDMTVSSGTFRDLCGASLAYGLTEGGALSDQITLTPLARRIVSPTSEGDDHAAQREAALRPEIINQFLTKYNNNKLPPEKIAINVLEEMGVPTDRAQRTFELIVQTAEEMGFLRDIKGNRYVDLEAVPHALPGAAPADTEPTVEAEPLPASPPPASASPTSGAPSRLDAGTKRVFITHGKNKEIVAQLKELLTFGKFDPVVSVERETVSKPVPDKVLDDMRSCFAAIIHVGTEMRLLDDQGQEHRILNPNVLIEIGAAMALYRRQFILLVEKGVTLPSNLQGLYEVRYEGERLDYESTMKLLKAFNDFRA